MKSVTERDRLVLEMVMLPTTTLAFLLSDMHVSIELDHFRASVTLIVTLLVFILVVLMFIIVLIVLSLSTHIV